MLRFSDNTNAIDEPKTARMEQRTKPHVKAQIQAAAALLGIDETAFITNAAYVAARRIAEEHERTVLTAADRDAFLAALDTDAEPTDAMREAAALHQRTIVNDE